MKKLVAIILIAILSFSVACSIVATPITEEAPQSLTYNGSTTYWEEQIPLKMDFETGSITLNDYYIGETDTGTGYSTIVQIEFVYPDEMDEKERHWFFKDDFTAFLYIENEDGGLDESYMLKNQDVNDLFGIEMQTIEDSVYFNCTVQRNGRYSVEGSEIRLILHYYTDDHDITYYYDEIIDESHMAKFGTDLKCTFTGDVAAAFIARKAQLLVEEEAP